MNAHQPKEWRTDLALHQRPPACPSSRPHHGPRRRVRPACATGRRRPNHTAVVRHFPHTACTVPIRYHRTLQAERARAKSVWAGMGNGSAPNSAALMSLKSGRGSRQCRPSLEMISPVQAPPFASQTQARSFRPLELKKVQGSAWLTEVHLHPLAVTVAGAAVPSAIQPEEDVATVPHRTAEVRLPVHSTPSPVQLPRLSRTS